MLYFPLIDDMSIFDMTPIKPCTEYPWEMTSYMPYLLTRMAYINGTGAVFDFTSFEDHPYVEESSDDLGNDTLVAATFDFFPSVSDSCLTVAANSKDKCFLYIDGKKVSDLPCTRVTGEDERGGYWGVRVTVPSAVIDKLYGCSALSDGCIVKGNVFKAKRSNPGRHFGCMAPAGKDNWYLDRDCLSDFKVTSV